MRSQLRGGVQGMRAHVVVLRALPGGRLHSRCQLLGRRRKECGGVWEEGRFVQLLIPCKKEQRMVTLGLRVRVLLPAPSPSWDPPGGGISPLFFLALPLYDSGV